MKDLRCFFCFMAILTLTVVVAEAHGDQSIMVDNLLISMLVSPANESENDSGDSSRLTIGEHNFYVSVYAEMEDEEDQGFQAIDDAEVDLTMSLGGEPQQNMELEPIGYGGYLGTDSLDDAGLWSAEVAITQPNETTPVIAQFDWLVESPSRDWTLWAVVIFGFVVFIGLGLFTYFRERKKPMVQEV